MSKYVIALGLMLMALAPIGVSIICIKTRSAYKLSEVKFGGKFYIGIAYVLVGLAISTIGQ